MPLGQGRIGQAARSGEIFVADRAPGDEAAEPASPPASRSSSTARVTGAIAIFRLLPQKNGFEDVDRELFELLATHAATALYCTTLHAALVAEGVAR